MTKRQLIMWSIARDSLDFIGIGQIPPLSWLLDLPLIFMHFSFAGKAATIVLFELIPFVGILPLFTFAAFSYPDPDAPKPTERANTPAISPPVAGSAPMLPFVRSELEQ